MTNLSPLPTASITAALLLRNSRWVIVFMDQVCNAGYIVLRTAEIPADSDHTHALDHEGRDTVEPVLDTVGFIT
jgi:hypothetical protein